jgi:hypothetical protein
LQKNKELTDKESIGSSFKDPIDSATYSGAQNRQLHAPLISVLLPQRRFQSLRPGDRHTPKKELRTISILASEDMLILHACEEWEVLAVDNFTYVMESGDQALEIATKNRLFNLGEGDAVLIRLSTSADDIADSRGEESIVRGGIECTCGTHYEFQTSYQFSGEGPKACPACGKQIHIGSHRGLRVPEIGATEMLITIIANDRCIPRLTITGVDGGHHLSILAGNQAPGQKERSDVAGPEEVHHFGLHGSFDNELKELKCENPDCRKGTVWCPEHRPCECRNICQRCGGVSSMPCPDCHGSKSFPQKYWLFFSRDIPCSACAAKGEVHCVNFCADGYDRTCNCPRASCEKCKGEGIVTCNTCLRYPLTQHLRKLKIDPTRRIYQRAGLFSRYIGEPEAGLQRESSRSTDRAILMEMTLIEVAKRVMYLDKVMDWKEGIWKLSGSEFVLAGTKRDALARPGEELTRANVWVYRLGDDAFGGVVERHFGHSERDRQRVHSPISDLVGFPTEDPPYVTIESDYWDPLKQCRPNYNWYKSQRSG